MIRSEERCYHIFTFVGLDIYAAACTLILSPPMGQRRDKKKILQAMLKCCEK